MRNIVVDHTLVGLLILFFSLAFHARAEDGPASNLNQPGTSLQRNKPSSLTYQDAAKLNSVGEPRDIRLQNTLPATLLFNTHFQSENGLNILPYETAKTQVSLKPLSQTLYEDGSFVNSRQKETIAESAAKRRKSMQQSINEKNYEELNPRAERDQTHKIASGSPIGEIIQECSDAQSNLSKFEVNFSNSSKRKLKVSQSWLVNPAYFDQVWYFKSKLLSNELSNYLSLIDTYNTNCLSKIDKVHVGAGQIKAIVGVLSRESMEPEEIDCTAFRISNRRIVTAKHCLTALSRAIDSEKLNFTLSVSEQPERVKVIGETCALERYRALPDCVSYKDETKGSKVNADFAILEVEPMKTEMPQLDWTSSMIGESDLVILAAWNSYPKFAEIGKRALLGESTYQVKPEELYISKKGFCQIANVSKSCILHGCQSTEGGSGAPLLVWTDSGKIRIVGVHVSTAAKISGDSDCATSKVHVENLGYLGNVGIPVSNSISKLAKL